MKNWKSWLKGLMSAIIGGSANAITLMIVDPAAFNYRDQLERTLMVAFISGLVAGAFFLKQSPLPNGGS